MGLQKVTFNGANVSAKMDADLHHFLFSNQNGVLDGLKNSVTFTLANNTITFRDGYVSVYGRLIYIEEGTSINVTPDSIKFGYVILGVNTSDESVSLYIKEQSGSYPSLITTNLLTTDGLYELPICSYTKTTTSVAIDKSFERSIVKSTKVLLFELEDKIYNNVSMQRVVPTKITNGTYKITGYTSVDIDRSLITIIINGSIVVTFPGQLLFEDIGSYASIQYQASGVEYTLTLNYSNNTTTFYCGNNSHSIDVLFIYR